VPQLDAGAAARDAAREIAKFTTGAASRVAPAWVRRIHDATNKPGTTTALGQAPGIGIAHQRAMHVRSVLWPTLAFLPFPLFLACGADSGSNPSSGAPDSGAPSADDSGNAPTGPTTDSGQPPPHPGHDSGGGMPPSDSAVPPTPEAGDDSGGSGNNGDDASPDTGPIEIPTTKAVMYLDNWSGSFASWAGKIDFTKLTHLNLAFATVTGNNDWGNTIGGTSDVQAIVAAAHAKNVKVLVSLGGGGGDQSVIGAYKTASNIAPLVANLDMMVKNMGLDGVDVDLESPSDMQSSGNYPAFVSALISTFHPEGKLVTSALAEYIAQGQNTDATIVATLNSFDFINDMIYSATPSDFTNEANWWTGSPVNLPKQNLVWGVCFDGECANPSVDVVKQITMSSKDYGGIMIWDYTDSAVGPTIWPAIQSVL
jgi:hypothetical protein